MATRAVARAAALGLCAALGFPASGPAGEALAGTERVTLSIPTPQRIDTQGIKKILVTRFIIENEVPETDLNKEMVTLCRRLLRKRTRFEVLDVEPPPLPEQPIKDLLANSGFWRKLGEEHGADLIIAGKASFTVADRSGFVNQDEVSPITGQRVRRTRFVDREGFTLDTNLFFLQGKTGALVYEDHFSGENTSLGHADRLATLYTIFEEFEGTIAAILVPGTRTVQRHLFTD